MVRVMYLLVMQPVFTLLPQIRGAFLGLGILDEDIVFGMDD